LNGWRDGEKGGLSEITHMYSGIPSKGGGGQQERKQDELQASENQLEGRENDKDKQAVAT
jgi:hypothetical protein